MHRQTYVYNTQCSRAAPKWRELLQKISTPLQKRLCCRHSCTDKHTCIICSAHAQHQNGGSFSKRSLHHCKRALNHCTRALGYMRTRSCGTTNARAIQPYTTAKEPYTTTKEPCMFAKEPCISSAWVCTLTAWGDVTCSAATTSAPYTSTPLPTTTAGNSTSDSGYIHLGISPSKNIYSYIHAFECVRCV